MLNPVNRILTRDNQRQQKSKTNLLTATRKSSKKYSVVFKVEGEKFNLGEKN